MSYAAKVRRAVELLDREVPGWHEQIDLESLLIEDREKCVFGQLYGDFWAGLEAHWDAMTLDPNFGPDQWEFGLDGEHDDSSYRTLNRLWKYVIRARQAQPDFGGLESFELENPDE